MGLDPGPPRLQVPGLAPGEIHAWRFRLEGDESTALAMLDARERARAQATALPADRRRFLLAHELTRRILAAYLGQAPGSVTFATEDHGKPRLAGEGPLTFSLGRSADVALLAVGLDMRLGCDIESVTPRPNMDALANDAFTPSELHALDRCDADRRMRAFLTCWTRKQACLKAVGLTLAMAPRDVHVGTDRQRLGTRVREFGSPVVVESIIDDEDCVAAVAVAGSFRRVRPFDLVAEEAVAT